MQKDEPRHAVSSFIPLPSSFHRHWSSSGKDSALVQRRREFESHPVLLQQHSKSRAHDVAVAYCLAMAEVRVRLPLGALGRPRVCTYQGVGKFGNPRASGARDRRFKSGRPDCGACRNANIAVVLVLVRAGGC